MKSADIKSFFYYDILFESSDNDTLDDIRMLIKSGVLDYSHLIISDHKALFVLKDLHKELVLRLKTTIRSK